MKHIKKLFVLGMMICATLIFCGCSFASRTSYIYQYGESYTAGDRQITKDIDTINIDYRSEEVNIIGTDTDCISVTETCENEIDDARKVHSFIDGSTLYIRFCASGKNMDLNNLKKRLTVSIPSNYRPKHVLVNVSSSTVNCSGFEAGSVSVYSSSGDINIGCEANVCSLTASSGNIKMEQSADCESVNIYSFSGIIDCKLGNTGTADLHASSGKITLGADKITSLEIESSGGDIDLDLSEAPDSSDISASSGNITVCLPDNADLTANASISSGKFFSNLPFMNKDGFYVLGSGRCRMKVYASSGDISLLKR